MKVSTICIFLMITLRIVLMILYFTKIITRETFEFDTLSDTLYLGILAIVFAIKELRENDD